MKKELNFVGFLARTSLAIEKNLQSKFRIPVLQRSCELLQNFDQYSQIIALDEWTEKFALSKKMLLGFLSGNETPELTPSEELREYLLTFEIRENEITGQIDIIKNKVNYTVDELEYLTDSEGYRNTHFKRFLNSGNKNITVTKIYNPLQDLFFDLADKYKGENLISQLANCIPAYDFGDRENGFYQKRLEYYFRKWLYKSAGQALHIGKNDAMLLWVEPLGGSGKSYLNRWLFSLPEFEQYYLRIGENASYIDMGGISKGKFAVDWDELPLSQKRYLMFKSYIAMEGGQAYSKKTKSYESFSRQVNFIGSSNKANRERQPGFLLDDDDAMKRRILSVELEGRINYEKYLKEIDLKQLWGEAANGIIQAQKSNNKSFLTYECDYSDLREQNSRYVTNTQKSECSLILSKFKQGNKDSGRILNVKDMISELHESGQKMNLSKEAVGIFLSKKGYLKGRIGNYKGYWIK